MPVIITLLAVAAAALLGHMAATGAQPVFLLFLMGLGAAGFALVSPKASITLLVFSMLLSPKIGFGGVGGGREAVLRYDDVMLVVIFFAWLARTAVMKGKPFITSSAVQAPVLLYTSVYIVATLLGILRGDINVKTSMFYLLKFVEYFLLYFMTVNIVDREDIKRYAGYGLLVAFLVTVYAVYYYYSSGPDARATAPFEAALGSTTTSSEPASLGGYYLVIFGVLLGLLTEYSGRELFFSLGAALFMFPAFLLTFSRASYIGFAAMALAGLVVARRRRVFLALLFCGGLLVLSLFPALSGKVMDRITMTYRGDYANVPVNIGSVGQVQIEQSAAYRVQSIKYVLTEKFPEHPLIGWGVTGIGLGDTQYALLIGEVGILGLGIFFWMVYRVFSTARTAYQNNQEPWAKALSLGLMLSLIGLLFQSFGVNTFIIIRIMEPFWFLTALVTVLAGVKKPASPVET